MKNIKKFLLTMAMTMTLGTSAFAESGFEFILNVPLGAGISMPSKVLKDSGYKSGVGFDAGVIAQLGYMFQVKEGFGVSVLAELGYAHDSFGITMDYASIFGEGSGSIKQTLEFDSFQLGLLPKFNIGSFAIGIGGGVKVTLGGKSTIKYGYLKESVKLTTDDVLAYFTPPVIGYVKATFDYSIFFTDKFALNVGLYLGGDFIKMYGESFNCFDIGVELGLKFGPKA